MRLVRYDRSPQQGTATSLRVGEAPQPAWATLADDVQSFSELYGRLHARLVDHAERFLDRDDALDAVGDAMASLWIRWPSLSYEKRTELYAFGAVTHAIRALKRKKRKNRRLVSLDDAEAELDQQAVRAFAFEASTETAMEAVFDATLAAMPPRRREVFLLLGEGSLSYKAAAAVLGLRYETVHTHARLASRDLRAAFTRSGFRIANLKTRLLPSPKGGDTND
ncbi:MAG TPA: RNA polymerase sigma factor [Polyangiaceae bacterium]|nr:RNA polymerase sigma factor [Polyangiaceae bacterium]